MSAGQMHKLNVALQADVDLQAEVALQSDAASAVGDWVDDGLSIGQRRFLVPPRSDQLELLEQGVGTAADVAVNLAEMTRINRWLGGYRALTRHLYPLITRAAAGETAVDQTALSLVDLGAGSGDTARMLAYWAQRKRLGLTVIPLDLEMRHLNAASPDLHRISGIHRIQGDALALPFAADSIDFLISSLFLHHLAPQQIIDLLREAYRCARCAVVMSDLMRGHLPLAAFHLVRPVFARHPVTFHDGLLSVRRAYRPDELLTLARAAGFDQARVSVHFPWRMTLIIEKPQAPQMMERDRD